MLRLFMIVSGSFEALLSLSALVATAAVVGALGDGVDDSVIFLPGARRGNLGAWDCRPGLLWPQCGCEVML
jgi:hypothetical protein